jgi:ABC-2 type transport system ATP-binding protein
MALNNHRAIVVQDLTRDCGTVHAVKGISFDVEQGEIFGFLGPNGAGKTTTIRMLTGQPRPTSGSARVLGYDVVTNRDPLQARIGVVFEQQNVYERLTARDNLVFSARLYGVDGTRVGEVLELLGLTPPRGRRSRPIPTG